MSRVVNLARGRQMAYKNMIDLVEKWKVVRGDKVEVLSGKDKGKQGLVIRAMHHRNKVVVEGLNLVKKHVKSTADRKGGIFTIEAPLHYSKVALVDPQTGKGTRIAMRYLEDGTKVRISKESGTVIPKPEAIRTIAAKRKGGSLQDTPASVVTKVTFQPQPVVVYKPKPIATAAPSEAPSS
eukprot:TRINITY_DN18712_c0_g1_i1.p1 TRINITY_DN18712_c0_g1~~TRINITY_DN18712_c0_g1_i1.p1  ORF type:complete len:181 (-),score=43.95 TRINITY_DN18712_c0_g1_i1:92-634(-)